MTSTSDSDEEVMVAAMAAAASVHAAARLAGDGRLWSQPGRAPNRELGMQDASLQLDRYCFGRVTESTLVYREAEFERTFWMPMVVGFDGWIRSGEHSQLRSRPYLTELFRRMPSSFQTEIHSASGPLQISELYSGLQRPFFHHRFCTCTLG